MTQAPKNPGENVVHLNIPSRPSNIMIGGRNLRTTEDYARAARELIISISDKTHPSIRDQANEFGDHIERTILSYMRQAITADRGFLVRKLMDAGYDDVAKQIMIL
jgi:hypothetical protein